VAEVLGIKLSGFPAWFVWRTIYLMKLPGWGRRLKIAMAWTLELVLPPELVQLKLGGSRGISREHFEPGEEVFHQGDLGDRVYIILNGRAQVVKDGAPVAEIRSGECFGEMALLHEQRRSATVRCLAAMDVLALPKREFTTLTAHLPGLRESFEQVAEERELEGRATGPRET
jgi:NADH dehydrogenase